MMQIKVLVAAAACAFVLPVLAAESTTDTAKAVEKAKAEAKAEAKKPAAKEQVAGEVRAPVVTKDSVDKGNGATQPEPYTLRNERWVPKDDRS